MKEEKLQKNPRVRQESLCLYEFKRFNLHDKGPPPLPNSHSMALAIHSMQPPCQSADKEAGPVRAVPRVRLAKGRTFNSPGP